MKGVIFCQYDPLHDFASMALFLTGERAEKLRSCLQKFCPLGHVKASESYDRQGTHIDEYWSPDDRMTSRAFTLAQGAKFLKTAS